MSGLVDFSINDAGNAISGIFTGIREAITGEKIVDPQARAEVQFKLAELETRWMEYESKINEYRHNVIVEEARGGSWIQRNWRPLTMLVFVFIIANNYILVPYAEALFSVKIPALELSDWMWETIKMGLGGYIVGRSGEKIAKSYFEAKK